MSNLNCVLDFIIAWTIFGSTGVVLDIKNTNANQPFFNCNFFSSYTAEDEKLFLSTEDPLTVINIHNIPLKIHYKNMVKLIAAFHKMTSGWKFEAYGAPTTKDVSTLAKMIASEIAKEYTSSPYSSMNKIPKYISYCFHQLIKSRTHIEINIREMLRDKGKRKGKKKKASYGYSKFESIFLMGNSLKYGIFVKLLYNLKEMEVYYLHNSNTGFEPSLSLDDEFVAEIISSIIYVNQTVGCLFNKLMIIEPKDSIQDFINKYQTRFREYDWNLKKIDVQKQEGNAAGLTSTNVLSIYRD